MILGTKIRMGAGRENPNLTSGSSASAKDIKIADLKTSTPLDHGTALSSLKDNRNLYFMILGRFKSSSLLPLITQISQAADAQNWARLKEAAHSLKGSSGYAGASHLHYDCYFMQDAFNKKDPELMVRRYNRLIENTA